MPADDPAAKPPVALLVFQSASEPETECKQWPLPVFANDQFNVGRQLLHEAFGIADQAVSLHHVRLRCIMYEDEGERSVQPMVYAQVLSSNGVHVTYRSLHKRAQCFAGKDHHDILLNNGDCLRLSNTVTMRFSTVMTASPDLELSDIQQAEVERFSRRFVVSDRVLGKGAYASVHLAIKQSNLQQLACKVVPISFLREQSGDGPQAVLGEEESHHHFQMDRDRLAREYNVLKALNHPNVVSLEKVICTTSNVYIFQELITGGDLTSYLEKNGPLNEPQGAVIVRQVLEAVRYLHANNVVHRDIKPENILMTSWRDGARIVLTDFGQSRKIEDASSDAQDSGAVFRMQSLIGTIGYTAPEVFRANGNASTETGYSKAIDMWSIGCLAATMFANCLILPSDDDPRRCPMSISEYNNRLATLDNAQVWKEFSSSAKSFIRRCLALDERRRLTAEQGLAHPWFTHPQYRADFDAAYARAISDWQPRECGQNVIEMLDTTDALPQSSRPEHIVRSHHFPAPPSQQAGSYTTQLSDRSIAKQTPRQQNLSASPIHAPESFQPSEAFAASYASAAPSANFSDTNFGIPGWRPFSKLDPTIPSLQNSGTQSSPPLMRHDGFDAINRPSPFKKLGLQTQLENDSMFLPTPRMLGLR